MKSLLITNPPPGATVRSSAVLSLIGAALLGGAALASAASAKVDQALTAYDTAVNSGTPTPVAKLTSAVTLDGTAGSAFDFGGTLGDVTMEFILQGDPSIGASGYLAVGENTGSNLRYNQNPSTHQLGFTQLGVADYMFTPAVPSPTSPTHITFVWSTAELTMRLYVNGTLAGTTTEVSDTFAMPTGPGFLGSNPTGTEVMTGTIYRVTVYQDMLPESAIKSHADAFINVLQPAFITSFTANPTLIDSGGSAVLSWQVQNATSVLLNGASASGTNQTVSPSVTTSYTLVAANDVNTNSAKVTVTVNPPLGPYDAAIAADTATGLTPLLVSTNVFRFAGTGGEPFDFGASSGDVTMEFILEGDPEATGGSGYLAVGENTSSSLRYEQWENTHQMGFTQAGVADYLPVPPVPSPTIATHIAYVWNATDLSMKMYANGVPAGTVTGVSDAFTMPSGAGFLGANASGGEPMVGSIYRVVIYDDILTEAAIKRHADALTSVLQPPIITSFTSNPTEIIGQGSATLSWNVQNASTVLLNGVDVTSMTNQTVSPSASTSYTLIASNKVSAVTAKLTLFVSPSLTAYDAAIAADTTKPLVYSTNVIVLNGGGNVPFDFGANSGDVTMEFVMEGDPVATGDSGYLAVGENASSNLRYDQWQDTRQMGFTQLGVADYLFTPEVPSPTSVTLVTYVWNATDLSMTLYINGTMAGTSTGVSDQFAMPTGAGFLGANPGGTEAMVGRILRVAVYDDILPEATIQKHGATLPSAPATGPSLAITVAGAQPTLTLAGTAGAHYRVEYRDSLSASDSWQLLQDIPSLSGTSIQVVDSTATTGRAQRFYRAVQAQ